MNIHDVFNAVSPYFRERRMRRFRSLVAPAPGDRILDVGGTPGFWREAADLRSTLTLLNPDPVALEARDQGVCLLRGDGCDLPFANRKFEIVFSNSAIEHVGSWDRQLAFAKEVRRVGKKIWVQTPAREFFVEPHLITPFFHWLPRGCQRLLMRNFTVRGWLERPHPTAVEAFLKEVRLLTAAEMRVLFPDCDILRERFLGMTKSYIAVRTHS